MTSKNYTQTSNWIFSNPKLTDRIKAHGVEYARLKTPAQFTYTSGIIKQLSDAYDPAQEKGGVVFFQVVEKGTQIIYRAVDVRFVTNIAEEKRTTYRPDPTELNKAYTDALDKNNLPFFFHTHPTDYRNGNIMMQGMNFLQQLNTSIADQGLTRRGFVYNDVNLRLPELLIVENSKALFIGMYGGLIAPLCFTEQKNKAIQSSMERTFENITESLDTPAKRGWALFAVLGLAFLAIRYPKVVLPTAVGAGVAFTPMMFANQDKHLFFGVTYGTELTIHIDKIPDEEILDYEEKAIKAYEERLKQIEAEKKQKQITK